jgi:hypothetical protein
MIVVNIFSVMAKVSRSDSLDSVTNDLDSLHSPKLVIENGPMGDEEVSMSTPVKESPNVEQVCHEIWCSGFMVTLKLY